MPVQPIHFGDEGQVATREMLRGWASLVGMRPELADGPLQRYFGTLESLDRHYGGSGRVPLEDAGELVDAALAELAHLEPDPRRTDPDASRQILANLAIGVALWAVRHEVPVTVVEPLANALAIRSNAAAGKPELSAVVGLMHGIIAHVAPGLRADLERSNPERAWRILHVNFAITAIRTEDPRLMALAFDALDEALPDERAGFYGEALALALAPGIAPEVREALEARHRKWNLR